MVRVLYFALIWSGALILGQSANAADGDWKARFMNEAPKAWRGMLKQSLQMRGVLNYEDVLKRWAAPGGPATEEVSERARREFAINGDFMRVRAVTESFQKGKRELRDGAAGLNSRYLFALTKKDGSGPFSIRHMSKNQEHDAQHDVVRSVFDTHLLYSLCSAMVFHGKPLDSIIGTSEFKVVNVIPATDDGLEQCVQVHFTADHPRVPILDGVLICDPHKRWRVVRWETTTPKGRAAQTIEYDEAITEIEFPKRIVLKYLGDGTIERHKTTTFTELKQIALPESEFTIGAFGMQEIDPYFIPPPSNVWKWLLAMGIAGLVTVAVMTILVYKGRSAAAQSR